ncbi:MAG TPA: 3-dehydroquinate synthase [Pyrinomonadaceae bacterium]|nr:3-dehydroquinate synthase [Pyrinomonadaceae bacterium]
MPENTIRISNKSVARSYEVLVGASLLPETGTAARQLLGDGAAKILVVSNPRVFGLYGETIKKTLLRAGFETSVWLMKDGERYKSFRSLERLLAAAAETRLSRTDAIVALGGGVVGDLAGFASAVYMRGIRFIQVPTTLLAMIDSSVGGKTGINLDFGKNLVGSFHNPSGVFADVSTLATLPRREIAAGLYESVKHGILAGGKLFNDTAKFLQRYKLSDFGDHGLNDDFYPALQSLIASQVAFKASVVRSDEREDVSRSDARSRKILNLGHTVGHALEKVTEYRRLKHGEAVGYGLMAAARLSNLLDILPSDELELLNDVLHRVGKLPPLTAINAKDVVKAVNFDKKSVGGDLQWVLLEGVGKPVIVSGSDIPRSAVTEAVKTILKK